MDVVVVIRFVAMEIIPRKRLAQDKRGAKPKIERGSGRSVRKAERRAKSG